MAMSSSKSPTMSEMNMTPLIDVLLVLLIMFIMTIPVASHSVEVDLPVCGADCDPPEANTIKNKIVIDTENRILWNAQPVTEAELVTILRLTADLSPEPELQFEPAPTASYDRTARVLSLVKASGVTKFGFVGNERYRDF